MNFQPYHYQTRAFNEIRELFRGGKRSVMCVAPMRAGKTALAGMIVQSALERGHRCLYIAHREELIRQPYRTFREMFRLLRVGVIKRGMEDHADLGAPIQIAGRDTLARRLETIPHDFTLTIIDEAHHVTNANTYGKILEWAMPSRKILLTGTPYRLDGKGFSKVCDALVSVSTIPELIFEGRLVPPRYFRGASPDLHGISRVGADFNKRQLAEACDTPVIVGNVIGHFLEHCVGRQAILYAPSVDMSRRYSEEFIKRGTQSEHIDGESEDRQGIIERFRSGQTRVCCNYEILTEGTDLPMCSAIIDARPTLSRSLYRQYSSRGLGAAPGKQNCLIMDHSGNSFRHGFLTCHDTFTLEEGYKKVRPPREYQCPNCAAWFDAWPLMCPECGSQMRIEDEERSRRPPRTLDEDLVEVGDEPVSMFSLQDKRDAFSELVKKALSSHKGPGWVSSQFEAAFGEKPTPEVKAGIAPETVSRREKWGWTTVYKVGKGAFS